MSGKNTKKPSLAPSPEQAEVSQPAQPLNPLALEISEEYQLIINGKDHANRGLDLACNPYNGTVLGDVVLVPKSLLHDEVDEEEHTVCLFRESKEKKETS